MLYYASFALSMSRANLDLMLSGSRLHCGLSTERSSVALWVVPFSSQSVTKCLSKQNFVHKTFQTGFCSVPTRHFWEMVKVDVHEELETTREKSGNRKVWIIDIQTMEGFFLFLVIQVNILFFYLG